MRATLSWGRAERESCASRRPAAGSAPGYRVVTYFCADDIPVFIMDVYAKGDKINLSAAERAELKKELEMFAREYRETMRDRVTELKARGEVS
jgi:hypothetical protein